MNNNEENKQGIIFGTLSLGLTAIIVKLIGALYKVPLSYMLGDEGMGYFNTAYTVYGLFYILCASGLPKGMLMVFNENEQNKGRVVKYSASLLFAFGSIASLLLIGFSPILCNWLGNSSAVLTLIFIAPSVAFVCGTGVLRGYFNSVLHLQPNALSQLIEALSKLVLGLAFAYVGVKRAFPLYLISSMAVLGITVGSLLSFVQLSTSAKKLLTKDNIRQKTYIDKKRIAKGILKYTIPISFGSAILSICGIIDMKVILNFGIKSGLSQSEASALYGNYSTLVQPMIALGLAVISPIALSGLSIMNKHYHKGQNIKFDEALNRVMRITMTLSIPITVMLMIYPLEILDFLFSREQSIKAAPMLILLAPTLFLLSYQGVLNTALEAKGKITSSLFSLLIGGCIKMVLSIIFLFSTDLGISGVPLSAIIGDTVGCFISLLLLKPGYQIALGSIPRIIFSSLIAIALPKLLLFGNTANSVLFIVNAIISVLIYLILTAIFELKELITYFKRAKYTK